MIPRQPRTISFYDEYIQILQRVPTKIIPWTLIINNILVTVILITFTFYDSQADDILRHQNVNNTNLHEKYGYNSITLAYPYLKDQIVGPGYQIIQCDYIDSSGPWQDHWCVFHKRLLCKRAYRISKLWLVYQYQYRKGLWLKKQKEKSNQQNELATDNKNDKSDIVDNKISTVEVVTIE
ncbi:15075_t:CDS:2 [Dentiscutata erythropus]|uniref:15075_t:CDS:1 n=1 Tax=Dentiscutata erythropus TaxID=1348616 RepID=A0A9N9HQ64_9GLOM|nr:15075_t:CDS:2 [Dentiscutata erythropus]